MVAILRGEPDCDELESRILSAPERRMSAAGYLETSIVVDGQRNPILSRKLDEYLLIARIGIADFAARQAKIARMAYRDFGKGSGHPAQLNFGDCLAYALAVDQDEPLLFKGNDFNHTDVRRA